MTPEFSFDDLNILGASKTDVYIRGRIPELCDMEHGDQPCVLIMKRGLLKKALDQWLTDKALICTVWNPPSVEFCGVMGNLRASEFTELPKDRQCELLRNLKDNWESQPVRTFRVVSLDEGCDMEHG